MAEANTETTEPEVRWVPGSLTPIDDPTVGGECYPYAGIGCRQLDPERRRIGEPMRKQLFPDD